MIYLFLVILALNFLLLGFFLCRFYFGKSGGKSSIFTEIKKLQKALAEKDKEAREAQAEISKTTATVQSLEQQISQRNEELEALQIMANQQDEVIGMLQKVSGEIRLAIAGAASSQNSASNAVSLNTAGDTMGNKDYVQPGKVQSVHVTEASKEMALRLPQKAGHHAWRKNLNNILEILDTMEKEMDK